MLTETAEAFSVAVPGLLVVASSSSAVAQWRSVWVSHPDRAIMATPSSVYACFGFPGAEDARGILGQMMIGDRTYFSWRPDVSMCMYTSM